ncbi:MAG TPA: ribosome-associated translation inhibitor RaiA [Vicinamibacteria bacterium]|nr:ribosome-associated translation inhibitor RaiA [Vicinamibacteria bacterium]
MKIEFTGRQTEVPAAARRVAERKLAKLGRLLPSLTRAHVTLSAERHRQVAEVSVHSRHLDLAAVEATPDAAASVASAIEKLLRQAEKQRTRIRERKGGASPRLTPAPLEPAVAAGRNGDGAEAVAPRVIRARRAVIKPMTLEEATLEMEARSDAVLVFRDAGTERVSVLFRRKDGNLGLIEPEA